MYLSEIIANQDIKLIQGDCLKEHKQIESGSVDLILTDLPYGTVKGANLDGWKGTKTDWDVVVDTDKIMQIANRILRKNGKMILTAKQPFTTELINKAIANVPFNYSMIWLKDHFANSLYAKRVPLNYYEDVLVFSKNYETEAMHPLRTYFKILMDFMGLKKKEIINKIGQCADHCFRVDSTQYELCTEKTYNELIDVFYIDKMQGFKKYVELRDIDDQFKKDFGSIFNLWEGNKYKSNILKYKKDYNRFHPTQKPILLLEDLIKTFSNKNDLIVDLTMGSGSTGVACKNLNRKFIGIELDEKYFKIAQDRIG